MKARLSAHHQLAADLRGVDRFDHLVRLSVIHAHRADPEFREARLAEMADYVKEVARITGKDNGINLSEADLSAVAVAVALDARAFLALMPEGGRA